MYEIEDHVIAVRLKRGEEAEDKEIDIVATYTAMQDLAADDTEPSGWPSWLASFSASSVWNRSPQRRLCSSRGSCRPSMKCGKKNSRCSMSGI